MLRSLHQDHALASFARLCPNRAALGPRLDLEDAVYLPQDSLATRIAAEAPEVEIDGTILTAAQLLHVVRSISESNLQNVTTLCNIHSSEAPSSFASDIMSSLSTAVLHAPCLAKLALHNVPCTAAYFSSLEHLPQSLCRCAKELKLNILRVAARCEIHFPTKLLLFKAIALVRNLEVLAMTQWSSIVGNSSSSCTEPLRCLPHLTKILVDDASSEIEANSSRFPEWFSFQTSIDDFRVGPTSQSSFDGYEEEM